MPAQPLHDLDAFGNRRAEMPGAFHQVALVQVVRAYTNAHQVLHQFALDMHIIVDARQQDGLVAKRDAGARQAVGGLRQFGRDFIGVVNMDIEPQRVVFLQHIGQFIRNAHGHKDRYARTDAHDFDMRDFTQAAQDFFQNLGRQHQRVAAREQHIAHLRRALEVFDLHFELGAREGGRRIAYDA